MEGKKMMPDKCLNLVLLGGMGVGKSASGNTILGRQAFSLKKSSTKSVTKNVAAEVGEVCGLHITVYDTPGFSGAESKEELGKYEEVLQRCESGVCVFLLVIKADRFTEEERKTVEKIEKLLGEKRLKKTWILFTNGEQLEKENKTIDKVIKENEALKKLIQRYEDRFHVFNNKDIEGCGDQNNYLLLKVGQWNFKNLPTETLSRIPINISDTPADSRSSRRIVLLGKTGVGKSASGNTILGQKKFESEMSASSVTCECLEAHGDVSGRSVSVVDIPGFFDTQMNPEELKTAIAQSVYLSSPGPHAFLIVFRVGDRFTEHEQQIPQEIEKMFGKEVLKYSIILFTHGDKLKKKTIEKFIEESRALRDLVDQCGGRYHVFNNEDQSALQSANREQVNDLLQKIDTMIEQNGGGYYSNQMFKDAERFRQEEEKRRQREEEKRKQQNEKQIEDKIRAQCEAEKSGFQKFVDKYNNHLISAAAYGATGTGYGACFGSVPGAVVGTAIGALWGFLVSFVPPSDKDADSAY